MDSDYHAFRSGFLAGISVTRDGFNGEALYPHCAPLHVPDVNPEMSGAAATEVERLLADAWTAQARRTIDEDARRMGREIDAALARFEAAGDVGRDQEDAFWKLAAKLRPRGAPWPAPRYSLRDRVCDLQPGMYDFPPADRKTGSRPAKKRQESIESAILRLRRLPDNWDGEGSPPPTDAAVTAAEDILAIEIATFGFGEEVPAPRMYPISEGGVRIEWRKGARSAEIEIMSDGSARFLIGPPAVSGGYLPKRRGAERTKRLVSLLEWVGDRP